MRARIVVITTALVVSGCQNQRDNDSAQTIATPVVLYQTMKDVIAPQAQILWDVSNEATGDDGNPDPSKLKDSDWARITEAGSRMKAQATAIATTKQLTVAPLGQKIQDEGSPGASSAQQVQGFVDADRQSFSSLAGSLAASADDFIAAAKTRDATKLVSAGGALDQACEACHTKFWYPQLSGAQK